MLCQEMQIKPKPVQLATWWSSGVRDTCLILWNRPRVFLLPQALFFGPFIQISTFIFKITPSVVKGDRRERKGGAEREEERRRGEKEKRERDRRGREGAYKCCYLRIWNSGSMVPSAYSLPYFFSPTWYTFKIDLISVPSAHVVLKLISWTYALF